MEYNMYAAPNELTHHGIKGMKWGVRRYQRKDGSLTNAGKKRRAKLESELEKLGGGKKESDGDSGASTRKKSIGEMSNKELQDHTTRMKLEKDYYEAQKQLAASVPPKQVSAGQKFANKMLNEVIMPAATNAGKAYLEKMMKEKMGIKEEVKVNWDDMIKKQTYEKNEKNKAYDDLKRQNDINEEKDRAETRNKKRAKAESDSGKSSDNSSGKSSNKSSDNSSDNSSGKSSDDTPSSGTGVKGEKWGKRESSDSKVHEGTVEGTGTSKKTNSEPTWSSRKETVIDADYWSEVEVPSVSPTVTNSGRSYVSGLLGSPSSNVPAVVTNRGQSYISGLLEEPKGMSRR